MTEPLTVGQQVWIYDINRRGKEPERAEVVKVGRKLVTIKRAWDEKQYRIEDGTANDNYGHSHFLTDAQRTATERRAAAVAILIDARLRPEHGCKLDVETLEAIAALVSA